MSWFTAKCPVSEEERLWIEDGFIWLVEEFGAENLLENAVILPTDKFFPDLFQGREDDVNPLLVRVCEYMDVDREKIRLKFFSDGESRLRHKLPFYESDGSNNVAGYFQHSRIRHIVGLDTSQLKDPTTLVGTIAHELGHVRLLGGDHISHEEPDHEPLTDLFTVYYGLGVFTANSSFRFSQFSDGIMQGWQARRLGYLNEEMLGYALGLYAWLRNESNEEWTSHLATNVKSFFKSSYKYILKNQSEISSELKQIALPR